MSKQQNKHFHFHKYKTIIQFNAKTSFSLKKIESLGLIEMNDHLKKIKFKKIELKKI